MKPPRQRSDVERQAHVLANRLADPRAFINPEADPADDPAKLVGDLRQLGQRLLRHDGSCMALQPVRHDPGREILRWRDVSLRLPASLLVGAACAGTRPAMGGVRLLDRTLAPTHPVALLHVHQGSVGDFELLWARLRLQLLMTSPDDKGTYKDVVPERFDGALGIDPRMQVRAWYSLLRTGFVVRECLSLLKAGCPLPDELPAELDPLWCRAWHQFVGRQALSPETLIDQQPVAPVPIEWQERLLVRGRESQEKGQDSHLSSGLKSDVDSELNFLATAFERCKAGTEADTGNQTWPSFALLLVQYIRLKCMLFRHMVADVDKIGFQSFKAAYDGGRPYHNPQNDDTFEAMSLRTTLAEPMLNVKAIEIRCAPNYWIKMQGRMEYPVSPLVNSSSIARTDVESGWVLHFIRDYHEPVTRGACGALSSRERVLYTESYKKSKRWAEQVTKFIEESPRVLRSLRGLDLAGNETNEPLWINLPHLRSLREGSIEAAGNSPHSGLEPLRITVHVGEVYAHRASGLRAVHEPIAWGLLHRGDRLGHALVLGLPSPSPSQQSEPATPPLVTRWNRLLDLGWMRYCTLCFDIAVPPHVPDAWRREAEGLVRAIWPGPDPCAPFRPDVDDEVADLQQQNADLLDWLAAAWLGLAAPNLISALGFPTTSAAPLGSVPVLTPDCEATFVGIPARVGLHWLHSYLFQLSTRYPAEEQAQVAVDQDCEMLDEIQIHLLRRIARWQIFIEVNPTSNLIIAGLNHPLDQPMFQLRPVDARAAECVPIVLSSDNPITLATTLADEYAYAWAGIAVGGGRPPTYAREWLDEVAANSMRARFTVPSRATPIT